MVDQAIDWRFGETEADAIAWMSSPALLHAYVDFRTPETPRGMWHRAMVVTRSWVERQVTEGAGSQSWPALIIVSDSSLAAARRSIEALLAAGGWRIVMRNASIIKEGDRVSEA
jgi:hypothetical protein